MPNLTVAERAQARWVAFLEAHPSVVDGWPANSALGDPVASALAMVRLLEAGYVSADGGCWCCQELPEVDVAVAEIRAGRAGKYRREVKRAMARKA